MWFQQVMFKVNGHGPGSKVTWSTQVSLKGHRSLGQKCCCDLLYLKHLGAASLSVDRFKISKGKVFWFGKGRWKAVEIGRWAHFNVKLHFWAHLCECTVGSYALLSVCLSVCDLIIIDWTKNHWTKIHISKTIAHTVLKFGLGVDEDGP